jgi:DNA end-binding protein Ku
MIEGLVVPVAYWSATKDVKVHFHNVHAADGGRARIKKYCEKCGEDLDSGATVKGYEILIDTGKVDEDGNSIKEKKLAMLRDDEIADAKPVSNHTMRVKQFCKLGEIDPVAMDASYYLGTGDDKNGAAFTMMRKSMVETNEVAIVEWTSRSHHYTGVLIPRENGFLLKTLLNHEEIRPFDIKVADVEIKSSTVKKGMKVVEKLTAPFDHSTVKDTTVKDIMVLIEARARGQELPVEKTRPMKAIKNLEDELDAILS